MSHHHHPHDDSSEHKHDYAKANAEHFDKESKNQEMIEHGTKLAQLSTPYILKYHKFDKKTTEVLDFAAGWGMAVLGHHRFSSDGWQVWYQSKSYPMPVLSLESTSAREWSTCTMKPGRGMALRE
jgi:hypothetical protein